VGEALSEGCHLLLDEGAVPMVGPRSLDRWLGRTVKPRRGWTVTARGQPAPWSPDSSSPRRAVVDRRAAAILKAVRSEPGLDLDAIAVRTGVPISALAAMVVDLEIEGSLERWPGGRYHSRAV
jgi:DNA processing protein